MPKNSAITIRLPTALRKRLESRAASQRRSLSAQVVVDLEHASGEAAAGEGGSGRLLGLFEGTRTPSDQDIQEVRSHLWGSLGRRG